MNTREADAAFIADFFTRHALGTLAAPSCFMCGDKVPGEAPIQHMELPGIVGCQRCLDACRAAKQLSSTNSSEPTR